MSKFEDLLFGRIVERSGLASPAQVRECVAIQERSPDRPIGEIFVEKGYLSREQLEHVLDIQRTQFERPHQDTRKALKDSLFGQLVLLKQFARSGDVHECLRLQQKLREHDEHVFLGELLVMKGRMAAAQVAEVLREQNKMLLFCDACYRRYNIPDYDPKKEYRCETCQVLLHEPTPVELVDASRDIAGLDEP